MDWFLTFSIQNSMLAKIVQHHEVDFEAENDVVTHRRVHSTENRPLLCYTCQPDYMNLPHHESFFVPWMESIIRGYLFGQTCSRGKTRKKHKGEKTLKNDIIGALRDIDANSELLLGSTHQILAVAAGVEGYENQITRLSVLRYKNRILQFRTICGTVVGHECDLQNSQDLIERYLEGTPARLLSDQLPDISGVELHLDSPPRFEEVQAVVTLLNYNNKYHITEAEQLVLHPDPESYFDGCMYSSVLNQAGEQIGYLDIREDTHKDDALMIARAMQYGNNCDVKAEFVGYAGDNRWNQETSIRLHSITEPALYRKYRNIATDIYRLHRIIVKNAVLSQLLQYYKVSASINGDEVKLNWFRDAKQPLHNIFDDSALSTLTGIEYCTCQMISQVAKNMNQETGIQLVSDLIANKSLLANSLLYSRYDLLYIEPENMKYLMYENPGFILKNKSVFFSELQGDKFTNICYNGDTTDTWTDILRDKDELAERLATRLRGFRKLPESKLPFSQTQSINTTTNCQVEYQFEFILDGRVKTEYISAASQVHTSDKLKVTSNLWGHILFFNNIGDVALATGVPDMLNILLWRTNVKLMSEVIEISSTAIKARVYGVWTVKDLFPKAQNLNCELLHYPTYARPHPQFTYFSSPQKSWESLFEGRVLARGRTLAAGNFVNNIQEAADAVTATVYGTQVYHVHLLYSKDRHIKAMSCTCPYASDGLNCKHMAALLYKLSDQIGDYN